MDLSLLYFVFPRLAESRRILSRKVAFGNVNTSMNIQLKRPLPIRRKRQFLRLVIDREASDIGCGGFVSEKPDQFFSVVGLAHDPKGEPVRYPFKWVGWGGANFDFVSDSASRIESLEVTCRVKSSFDLVWVCTDSTWK